MQAVRFKQFSLSPIKDVSMNYHPHWVFTEPNNFYPEIELFKEKTKNTKKI
jgi:hypothetical protein